MLKRSHTARIRFRHFSFRLPRTLGNGGPYFAMILINAIGYGLFAPFSILYFHQVVGLSLPLVGLGLSIATGVGLVATPLGGPLIDRFGARQVAVVTNLLSAAGFAAYLSVHSFAGFLIVALFLAVGSCSGEPQGQPSSSTWPLPRIVIAGMHSCAWPSMQVRGQARYWLGCSSQSEGHQAIVGLLASTG